MYRFKDEPWHCLFVLLCFLSGDKIYWGESDTRFLKMANIDGTNIVTLTTAHAPKDIVIYYNNLYFVDSDDDNLFRMPKDGSSPPVEVGINAGQFSNPEGLHIEFSKSVANPCVAHFFIV